ncbi:MAG: hypothetical protein KKD39_04125, partial [Candidatus Altiarchaeota archaeon]|nr:hypothetical protein [Candidatus Altiarchaeota archaeon]
KETFGRCLEMAKTPGAAELIGELIPYGYKFDLEHSGVMGDMVAQREHILSGVKALSECIEGYEYEPQKSRSEGSVTYDPYLAYIQKQGAKNIFMTLAGEESASLTSKTIAGGLIETVTGRKPEAAEVDGFLTAVRASHNEIAALGDAVNVGLISAFAKNPEVTSVNLRIHGAKLAAIHQQLKNEPRYSYIPAADAVSRLLSQPKESLDAVMAQDYPPAALLGVFGMFEYGELTPALTQQLFKALPRSSDVIKDSYNVEYLTSYLHKNPEGQRKILTGYAQAFPNCERDDAHHLLTVMALTDSLASYGFQDVVQTQLGAGHATPAVFAKSVVGEAAKILSTKYDPTLISAYPSDKLTQWIKVYSTYEETLRHFKREDNIPIMRVIATVELMGEEKIHAFRRNDPQLLADLVSNAERYFPDETERAAALEYLQKRQSGEEEKKVLPEGEYSPEERQRIIAEFHRKDHTLTHTLSDVCVDDRLETIGGILDDLFHKRHFSPALQDIEMLTPGQNPMQELGERGTACSRLIGELTGKAKGKAKKGDPEREARIEGYQGELRAEVQGIPKEKQVEALQAIQQDIVNRQRSLGTWADVREIGVGYEGKLDSLTGRIKSAREALGNQAEVIESLGFNFTESFRRKVYSGDIELLSQATDKALAGEQEEARRQQLTSLNQTIAEIRRTYADAGSYLDGLVPGLTTTLGLLTKKKSDTVQLKQSLGDDTDFESCIKKVREQNPRLAEYIVRRARQDGTGDRGLIDTVLSEYEDSSAIQDVQNLISAIKPSESQGIVVHTYGHEHVFTRMLEAMKGQCLDYRSSVNSIGNAVYNMDLMDASRAVTVSRDSTGAARFDAIDYLTRVETDGKSTTAIVTDPFYVPDGSVLSWGKIEGHLMYLIEKADRMGVPLVVPSRLIANNEQRFADMQSEAGKTFEQKQANVSILTGPSDEVYCELTGYVHYNRDTQHSLDAYVYTPEPRQK